MTIIEYLFLLIRNIYSIIIDSADPGSHSIHKERFIMNMVFLHRW